MSKTKSTKKQKTKIWDERNKNNTISGQNFTELAIVHYLLSVQEKPDSIGNSDKRQNFTIGLRKLGTSFSTGFP